MYHFGSDITLLTFLYLIDIFYIFEFFSMFKIKQVME